MGQIADDVYVALTMAERKTLNEIIQYHMYLSTTPGALPPIGRTGVLPTGPNPQRQHGVTGMPHRPVKPVGGSSGYVPPPLPKYP